MSRRHIFGIEFVTEECCSCGMSWAMTADFKNRRLNDHKLFYCPAGHSQHYTGPTKAQRLERELAREQERSAKTKARLEQVGKQYRRVRERVRNGVCPCCSRTFQNLLNHMRTQHPEFGRHETFRAVREAFGLTQSALAEELQMPPSYVSSYENSKAPPQWAESALDKWLEANA